MAKCPEELAQENVSDEDKTKSCDSCSFRGVGRLADSHCPVCDEYLCLSCVETHSSFKATRAHALVMIVEPARASNKIKIPKTNLLICDIHRSDTLTEFCVTHESAICPLCKTTKDRKCETKDLGKAAEEGKSGVKYYIEDMKVLTSEFEKINSSRQNDKCQLYETTKRIKITGKKIKEEIIIWAEKLEKKALEEIERTEKGMVSKIDCHIAETAKVIEHLAWLENEFKEIGRDCCIEAFVLKTKIERQIQDGEEFKLEIEKEIFPPTCNFRKSETLTKLMSEITSFGTIVVEETRPIDFTDISGLIKKDDFCVESSCTTGCVFMSNGQLVVSDQDSYTLKVFTADFKLENELKCDSRPWDVAVLSKNEVIVTKPDSMCLDVLNVSGTVRKVRSITIGEQCWGVDIKKDNIYVSCHLQAGNGGNIKVHRLDGVCAKEFRIYEGNPYYLAVNDAEDKIIVCTFSTSKVLCMDMTGNTIFSSTDSQLECPLGLLFDSHDNFMVCGRESNTVHVVNQDGSKHKILLSSENCLYWPYCVAYRSTDRTIVVGQYFRKLTAFSVKYRSSISSSCNRT